jgi:hypothetical protein
VISRRCKPKGTEKLTSSDMYERMQYSAHMTRIASISVLGLAVGLALSACNPTTSSSAGGAASSATSLPVQTFPDGTFYSPSGDISCELNYPLHGQTVMACQTITPRVDVQMGITGKYTIICTGQKCGPSSPQPAPTLAYGKATVAGPFRCTSATTGVTCLAAGKGFQISRSGVTPVSA